jgi:hypothetical protein
MERLVGSHQEGITCFTPTADMERVAWATRTFFQPKSAKFNDPKPDWTPVWHGNRAQYPLVF